MSLLDTISVACPYCGESIELEVDCSITEQSYIEDCSVCCRPIGVRVAVDGDGVPSVETRHEDE